MSKRTINEILATLGLQSAAVPPDIQQDINTMAAALREAREVLKEVDDPFNFPEIIALLKKWDTHG